jgi:hypothetical protein
MSSRRMSLLPRATLHSDSEHVEPLLGFNFFFTSQFLRYFYSIHILKLRLRKHFLIPQIFTDTQFREL